MRGTKHSYVCAVGVDDVWVVCVGVDGNWSAVSPNIFATFCKGFPMAPLECLIFFSGFLDCMGECCGYSFCCIHWIFCWYFAMFGVTFCLGRCAVSTYLLYT